MKPILLTLLCLTLAAPAMAEPRYLPIVAVCAGEAADIGSTLYAIHHGAIEGNPMLGSFGASAIASKAATAVAMSVLLQRLATHGHLKLARALGYGSGVGLGSVAVYNLRGR